LPSKPTKGWPLASIPSPLNISSHLASPLDKFRVTSEFGLRGGIPHKGIDLAAHAGAPIYSVLSGTVIFSGTQRGYGYVVIINHSKNISTLYAHNVYNLVKEGDIVSQGQIIAEVGKSGKAQGYHLHFEYRVNGIAKNPRELLETKTPFIKNYIM
jgi:murein DD-endopeptidase MepM/ murein hydrolase activator NlpD